MSHYVAFVVNAGCQWRAWSASDYGCVLRGRHTARTPEEQLMSLMTGSAVPLQGPTLASPTAGGDHAQLCVHHLSTFGRSVLASATFRPLPVRWTPPTPDANDSTSCGPAAAIVRAICRTGDDVGAVPALRGFIPNPLASSTDAIAAVAPSHHHRTAGVGRVDRAESDLLEVVALPMATVNRLVDARCFPALPLHSNANTTTATSSAASGEGDRASAADFLILRNGLLVDDPQHLPLASGAFASRAAPTTAVDGSGDLHLVRGASLIPAAGDDLEVRSVHVSTDLAAGGYPHSIPLSLPPHAALHLRNAGITKLASTTGEAALVMGALCRDRRPLTHFLLPMDAECPAHFSVASRHACLAKDRPHPALLEEKIAAPEDTAPHPRLGKELARGELARRLAAPNVATTPDASVTPAASPPPAEAASLAAVRAAVCQCVPADVLGEQPRDAVATVVTRALACCLLRPQLAAMGVEIPKGVLVHAADGDMYFGARRPVGRTFLLAAMARCVEAVRRRFPALAANVRAVVVDAHSLVSKEVGSTERNIAALLADARKPSAPSGPSQGATLVFMDNLEVLAPPRRSGNDAADTGNSVADRSLSTLLTEMDGIRGAGPRGSSAVMLIASCPAAESVDAAMRRPGRLDLHIPLVPPGPEVIVGTVAAHLRAVLTAGEGAGGGPSAGTSDEHVLAACGVCPPEEGQASAGTEKMADGLVPLPASIADAKFVARHVLFKLVSRLLDGGAISTEDHRRADEILAAVEGGTFHAQYGHLMGGTVEAATGAHDTEVPSSSLALARSFEPLSAWLRGLSPAAAVLVQTIVRDELRAAIAASSSSR